MRNETAEAEELQSPTVFSPPEPHNVEIEAERPGGFRLRVRVGGRDAEKVQSSALDIFRSLEKEEAWA
jgi:hypothetical protein